MAIFRCKNHSSSWPTKRVGNKGIIEFHALLSDPINVRSRDMNIIISTNCLKRMIIRHHEQNIWPSVFRRSLPNKC
jgi:hypothetical protein